MQNFKSQGFKIKEIYVIVLLILFVYSYSGPGDLVVSWFYSVYIAKKRVNTLVLQKTF